MLFHQLIDCGEDSVCGARLCVSMTDALRGVHHISREPQPFVTTGRSIFPKNLPSPFPSWQVKQRRHASCVADAVDYDERVEGDGGNE